MKQEDFTTLLMKQYEENLKRLKESCKDLKPSEVIVTYLDENGDEKMTTLDKLEKLNS